MTTVLDLSKELEIPSSELIPLLAKLGIKKATETAEIPEAIANNIRAASSQRAKVLNFAKPTNPVQDLESPGQIEEVSRKLKPSEVRNIAEACNLTQVVVRGLEKAQHDREVQIAFLKGYQEIQRKQQQEIALESGKIAAQLQHLKERDRQLSEEEEELIEQGLSEDCHPVAIASKLGVDLDGLFQDLQQSTEKYALDKVNQQEAISKVLSGEEPTAEELANPFVLLAYRRRVG